MIFKQNNITNGTFYRVDKNLNNGKPTKRKLSKQTRGNFTINIPPVLVDMMNTHFVEIDFNVNKDGSLKEIIIVPVKENVS